MLRLHRNEIANATPFPSCLKARLNECEAIAMKVTFYSRASETHFHWKDFALSFVSKESDFGTKKLAYCLLRLVALNSIVSQAAIGTAAGNKNISGKDRYAGMLSVLIL